MTIPSGYSILRRDQFCGLMLRAIVALWLLWLAFGAVFYVGGESARVIVEYGAPRIFWAASLTSVLVFPLLLWRVMMIRRVFRCGKRVSAIVTDAVERQGIHQIWYRYEFKGRTIMGRNLVKQGGNFQSVKSGDRIEVSVLPDRPDRSFSVDLFR